jgi:hypothetical protein
MRRLRRSILVPALFAALHTFAGSATAQRSTAPPTAADSAAAFADTGAAALFGRARAARLRTDHSIRSYTAIVASRTGAAMRMPLKDRTLFRQETAARVRWSRDAETVVQMLAARSQHPGGIEAPSGISGLGIDELFDPGRDRMYFGLTSSDTADVDDDDDFWIEHPLGDAAERHYRYASGDTLTVRLQGGHTVRAIELQITPRRDDPHTVRGTLWFDAASGALVQAAFRLARTVDILRDMNVLDEDDLEDIGRIPGFLKPFEFDITLMTVEYSLWEMEHWLPRTMRIEGMARAGVLRFPASADVSYDMLDVELDPPDRALELRRALAGDDSVRAKQVRRLESEAARRVAAEWGVADEFRTVERRSSGRQFLVVMPKDSMKLLRSEQLPPPIWSDAPGFATQSELEDLSNRLASLGRSARRDVATHFGWGFGEADMLRYNRVEALSIGARFAAALPEVDAAATIRFGLGDLHPNAELSLRRETPRRTLELRGYHELTTADQSRAALGMGNSLSALMFGRDAGEYYRASGAALTWAPPSTRRRTRDVTAYAEYQNDVARTTHVALPRLWTDSVFRPNIRAAEAMQYGGTFRLRPWWGTDPIRPQFGIDMMLQGETGDHDLARASIALRGAAQLAHGVRIGAEAAAGSSVGAVTPQRMFYLGGAHTLRGYEPGTVAGTSMARGRLELARTASFGAVALFSDWGWAGDREDIRNADQRWAVGVGTSLLDGLLRVDLAHGLLRPRGWRLDLHLDSVL